MRWLTNLIIPIVLSVCGSYGNAKSLSQLRVGDNISSTARIGLSPATKNISGPFTIVKWQLPDGNQLSATARTSDGKIVYLECDWGGRQEGTYSDFPGFYYGKTLMVEMQNKFHSSGFSFQHRQMLAGSDNSIAIFFSYDLIGMPDTIVTFAFMVSPKDALRVKANLLLTGRYAKLHAIILGNEGYLSNTWGPRNVSDIIAPDSDTVALAWTQRKR
jgi:hypothetical protein